MLGWGRVARWRRARWWLPWRRGAPTSPWPTTERQTAGGSDVEAGDPLTSGARPTILVYRGDQLAAIFVSGAPPVYRGEAGGRVRALVEADHLRYNPWELEVRDSGLYHDTPRWFLASVLLGSGLARAGFRVQSFGEPGARPPWPLDGLA